MKTFLPLSRAVIDDTLEPLDEDEKPASLQDDNRFMLFSPSQEMVLERLYEQMVQSLFIQSFLELKASEYSSRMMAMQNATDAADRIIQDLTRELNKARQQAITAQIAELIGASMALEN